MFIRLRFALVVSALALNLIPAPAHAQDGWHPFVAGFGGGSLIPAFSVAVTDPATASGLNIDGRKLVNTAVGGGAVGVVRMNGRLKWGARADVMRQKTDADSQLLQATGTLGGRPYSGPFPAPAGTGSATLVTGSMIVGWQLGGTSAGAAGRISPYVGLGGGIDRVRIELSGQEGKDTGGLFQALGGVEIALGARVAIYAEYRFAQVAHTLTIGNQRNVFTAKPNNIVAGVAVLFD